MKWNVRPALVLMLLTSLYFAPGAGAADLRVDENNQTGVENGSALRPYRTLTAAVAAAQNDDRILVARGNYAGPVRVESKTLTLLGGYAGGTTAGYATNTEGDFSEPRPAENTTTIQGNATNAVVLLIESGASRVEGFTLRGGGGAREDAYRVQGGGVYISGGAPTLAGNIIENNTAISQELDFFGGGIYSGDADVTIENNIIRGNTSGRGGGITISRGSVRIRDNEIVGNIGMGDHGGGIYLFSQDAILEGNRIHNNEIGRALGYGWGGGFIVFNPGARAVLRFNEVFNNYAPSSGAGVFIDEGASALMEHCRVYANVSEPNIGAGGIFVDPSWDDQPSSLTMRHCTVYGHLTPEPTFGGNGLFVMANSTATVENCIFWGNDGHSIYSGDTGGVTVRYSTTEEAHDGPGNLTGDPLFANAPGGDFHLRSRHGRWNPSTSGWVLDAESSPCIDAADPASPFDREPEGNGGRANQGAYGNTPEASRTTIPPAPKPAGFMAR
jgi:hypothetical protein